ncbi:MAG: hypothetical protein ACK4PI_09035 [Tepidisphaerales bacterium]
MAVGQRGRGWVGAAQGGGESVRAGGAAVGGRTSEAPISYDISTALFYIVCRYLHVVCTTLLVGGTLFYEMVVPVAIGELRTESQLAVFGRARWVFRWIVWLCAVVILLTGCVITYQYWTPYTSLGVADAPPLRPGWWWAAHTAAGVLAILVSLMLTVGARPPDHPLTWMRFNLVLLLVVMFLASATRHVRDVQMNPPIPFLPPTFALPSGSDVTLQMPAPPAGTPYPPDRPADTPRSADTPRPADPPRPQP